MVAGYQSTISWMHIKRASGRVVKIGTQYLQVGKHTFKTRTIPLHIENTIFFLLILFCDPLYQINQERREEETGKKKNHDLCINNSKIFVKRFIEQMF